MQKYTMTLERRYVQERFMHYYYYLFFSEVCAVNPLFVFTVLLTIPVYYIAL